MNKYMLEYFVKTAFTKKIEGGYRKPLMPGNTNKYMLKFRKFSPLKGAGKLLTPAFGIFEGLSARSRVLKEPFVKL